jgi:hypothetical protein
MHAAAFLAGLTGALLVSAVAVGPVWLLARGTLVFVPAMGRRHYARARHAQGARHLSAGCASLKSSAKCSAVWKAPIIDACRYQQKNEYRHAHFFVAQVVAPRVALTQGKSRLERR